MGICRRCARRFFTPSKNMEKKVSAPTMSKHAPRKVIILSIRHSPLSNVSANRPPEPKPYGVSVSPCSHPFSCNHWKLVIAAKSCSDYPCTTWTTILILSLHIFATLIYPLLCPTVTIPTDPTVVLTYVVQLGTSATGKTLMFTSLRGKRQFLNNL